MPLYLAHSWLVRLVLKRLPRMLPINWLPVTSCAQFYTFIEARELVVCYVTAPWCAERVSTHKITSAAGAGCQTIAARLFFLRTLHQEA